MVPILQFYVLTNSIIQQNIIMIEKEENSGKMNQEMVMEQGSKNDEETNCTKGQAKQQPLNHQISEINQPTEKMERQVNEVKQTEKIAFIVDVHQEVNFIKDLYYKHRAYLYGWARNECIKFRLLRETYANSMCLMDKYFKETPFVQKQFIQIALCIMTISSKALQTKVLFTSTIARNNNFSFQETLKTERNLLEIFQYRVTSYNFVRTMDYYLKKWDNENTLVDKKEKCDNSHLFLKDCLQSYLLYEQIYSLCENYMRYNKSLLQQKIKVIMKFVLSFRYDSQKFEHLSEAVDLIFTKKKYSLEDQQSHAYEILTQCPSEQELLMKWREEFKIRIPALQERYSSSRKNYLTYGDYLSYLI